MKRIQFPKIDKILIHFIKDDRHGDKVAQYYRKLHFNPTKGGTERQFHSLLETAIYPSLPSPEHLKFACNQRYIGTRNNKYIHNLTFKLIKTYRTVSLKISQKTTTEDFL